MESWLALVVGSFAAEPASAVWPIYFFVAGN